MLPAALFRSPQRFPAAYSRKSALRRLSAEAVPPPSEASDVVGSSPVSIMAVKTTARNRFLLFFITHFSFFPVRGKLQTDSELLCLPLPRDSILIINILSEFQKNTKQISCHGIPESTKRAGNMRRHRCLRIFSSNYFRRVMKKIC